MKSIGIDISGLDPNFKEHSIRGIGRYAQEINKYFTKTNPTNDIGFFNHADILKGSICSKLIDFSPFGRQTLKQQLLYPMKLNSSKLKEFDILHFLAQTDAPSWSKKKYILTVHDIIPIVCADMYKANNPNWRYKLARFLELQSIKNAEHILTISENSKKDLVEHLSIDPNKITVTYLGVDNDYFNQEVQFDSDELKEKFKIDKENDFLLYVGGIDPRKNYAGLISIYKKLVETYREKGKKAPKLVFAGKISKDKEYPRLLALIKKNNLENEVVFTGFVEDSDLLKLYKACKLFCFFSLYEGFGLTPLEALASGAVVVSSNRSAMPEVLGDAALLIDPDKQDEASRSMYELLNNKDLYESYRSKAKAQARKFDWEKTGDVTLEAYKSFYNI